MLFCAIAVTIFAISSVLGMVCFAISVFFDVEVRVWNRIVIILLAIGVTALFCILIYALIGMFASIC